MQARIRINRTYAVAAFDVVMVAISFAVALLLRRGLGNFWHESSGFFIEGIVAFCVISAIVFWRMRIYRGFWRYTSSRDVTNIAGAAAIAILIFVALLFVATRLEAYPRSALPINFLVLIALLATPRILYRSLMERGLRGFFQRANGEHRIPVLLLGAGDDAELFIRSSVSGSAANYRVVGLIDDEPAKIGRHIHGVRVYGPARDLTAIVRALKQRGTQPRRLILTSSTFDADRLHEILAAAEGLALPLSRLPRMTDFHTGVQSGVRSGESGAIDIKPVAIEDLLGRPQAALDGKEMAALIRGRRVCVTGAGGSIGSELCRQIAGHEPAHITLIDNSEFNLYTIDMELSESHPQVSRDMVLGDVRDLGRLNSTFEAARPQLVFHAAALKHVHMVEANPNEGVLTNVLGTRNVADSCVAHGVAVMVLISSDKAVNPSNVMGASKRIAESYCQALGLSLAARGEAHTRLVTVRFGNVLASSGSVVPLFQRQIAAGGPVTVTDPNVSRYFMTTREAVQLVLQASALGARGSGGEIFVLDMGAPVLIKDLASQMIRLAGLTPGKDIEIVYTGLRAGEKMAEELFHDKEPLSDTPIAGLHRALSRPTDLVRLRAQIERLCAAAAARKSAETLAQISIIVPEFSAAEAKPATGRRAAQ